MPTVLNGWQAFRAVFSLVGQVQLFNPQTNWSILFVWRFALALDLTAGASAVPGDSVTFCVRHRRRIPTGQADQRAVNSMRWLPFVFVGRIAPARYDRRYIIQLLAKLLENIFVQISELSSERILPISKHVINFSHTFYSI